MTNETKVPNPPAYPTHKDSGTWTEGLTMLDHFAGLAIIKCEGSAQKIAEEAYDIAAYMLIERQKHL
jgi:hypothetical protein